MYPSLLQLRIIAPVVTADNVLHDADTAEHTVDTVLRSLATCATRGTVITAAAEVVAIAAIAGGDRVDGRRCYCC